MSDLGTFLPHIMKLPLHSINKSDLLIPEFLIEKNGALEIYYAPHNEYINKKARIVIIGITPGWIQMKSAYEQAQLCIDRGDSLAELIISVKRAGRFAGTMRKNLIQMLDDCGINSELGILSSGELFSDNDQVLHTTSVIKYPVFFNGKNYSGHAPAIDQSPLLQKYAYQAFPHELKQLEYDFLLIPLGKSVSAVIKNLMVQNIIPEHKCLFGFPHPSGANGHRKKQFEELKSSFTRIVGDYFNG